MRVLLVVISFAAGCSLDRSGLGIGDPIDSGDPDPRNDGGQLDAGSDIDAALGDGGPLPELDAGLDSGMPMARDAGVDAGRDAGIDAGRDAGIDAGRDAGPPPLRDCGAIYASAPSYRLCVELATTCEIYVDPAGNSTCDAVCTALGGTCAGSFGDDPASECGHGSTQACTDSQNDMICVCTRIP